MVVVAVIVVVVAVGGDVVVVVVVGGGGIDMSGNTLVAAISKYTGGSWPEWLV